ncbi:MAG: ribonuclease Z [Bacilli bacterium]|nr:ribonuclease Z [Bacilli bacterium]
MVLKFLGRGSAFNINEGNTSAYFYSNGELFLIDCGESVFERIIKNYLLDNIKAINILITHTHGDHVGSLGSLILYCFYNLDIKINIILPSKHKYLNDLKDLLRIFGCKSKMYKFIYENELTEKYDAFNSIKFMETKHSRGMVCYGILFDTKSGVVYYSGDTKEITNIKKIIKEYDDIDKVYVDTSSIDSKDNPHVYVGVLDEEIPPYLRDKFYCMHINDKKAIVEAIDFGFKVVDKV